MKPRTLFAALVLILAILACNLPSNAPATPAPVTETVTSLPTQPPATEFPSATPLPSETPPPTLTPTPTIPIAWPLDKGVNCRYGPSTDWLAVSALLVGQNATITGKNEDASWWYVTTPSDPGSPCWVASSVTVTAGNLSNLPIIPMPSASVIGLKLKLDPGEINLPGCMGPVQPITFKGTIDTNGPADVKYYFETQQGGQMPVQELKFKFADSKSVEASYNPPIMEGTFWVKLVIVSPNDKTVQEKYKVNCP